MAKKKQSKKKSKKSKKSKKHKRKHGNGNGRCAKTIARLPLPSSGPLAVLAARLSSDVTPHKLAILADPAHQFSWLPWSLRLELAALWTPSRVAALSTPELLEQLAACGVTADATTFAQLAEGRDLAWTIAHQVWQPQARGPAPDNLLGLCAVELWKRWIPERPSREVLGSWVAEGYRLLETDRTAACSRWLKTWDVLSARIARRSTLEAAERLVDGGPPLEHWLVELAMELCVLAAGSPVTGPRAVNFCEEVIAQLQLATEDAWMHDRLMVALGDILFHLGERAEGESVYRALIRGRVMPTERMWMAEALAYSRNAATAGEIARAMAALEPVPDYGVGLGPEAEALQRLACLREHPPLKPAPAVARLHEVGRYLPSILSQRIVAAGDGVVPDLISLVERGAEADEVDERYWPGVHAIDLLGRIRSAAAVEPLISYLATCEPYENDEEACVGALSQIGEPALEPLLAAAAATTSCERRRPLRRALAGMDVHDDRIFELLLRDLDTSPDDASTDLWEYGDDRAIPIVRRKLEQMGEGSHDARHLRFALEELEGLVDPDIDLIELPV